MKAYKLKENVTIYGELIKKDRIIVPIKYETIVLANFTDETRFISRLSLDKLLIENKVYEVELVDEKWVHPHIHTKVREEL